MLQFAARPTAANLHRSQVRPANCFELAAAAATSPQTLPRLVESSVFDDFEQPELMPSQIHEFRWHGSVRAELCRQFRRVDQETRLG
jgi:hypothetical protein